MMMKSIYLVVLLFTFSLQSSYSQNQNIVLNENLEFKEHFFRCISNIEAYTLRKKNQDSLLVDLALFKNSLLMISKFTEVDYTLLTNYEFRYPNDELFYKEKEKWINWYEENKHNNLKW